MRINRIRPLTRLANNKQVQKLVNWAVKDTGKVNQFGEPITNLSKLKKHFPAALTIVLSSLLVLETALTKEILKDKKKSLIAFYTSNAAIIIAGTYAIMPSVAKFTKTLGDRFNKANMEHSERTLLEKGMRSMIPIVAIGIVSRGLSPILAAWFSGKKR